MVVINKKPIMIKDLFILTMWAIFKTVVSYLIAAIILQEWDINQWSEMAAFFYFLSCLIMWDDITITKSKNHENHK